jgi:2-polyprenyl-6-methoxyphenol hydroxylase-like FAD-dependent oxidoreductase
LTIELAAESTGTVPRGLARYEARRKQRVQQVQNQADRLARLSGVGGKTKQWVRDAALRLAGRLPTTAARLSRMAQQENPAELYRLLSLLTATPARDARQQGGASADGPP